MSNTVSLPPLTPDQALAWAATGKAGRRGGAKEAGREEDVSDGGPTKLDYATPRPARPSAFIQAMKGVLVAIVILLGLLFLGLIAITAI
jgi:hypothetical protein